MLGFLILLIAVGIGFAAGYGVRAEISRRRRRAARGDSSSAPSEPNEAVVAGGAERDYAINLERLLVAANDDFNGRRRQQQPQGGQPVDHSAESEEFDGAVRDLLGELNRRPPGASATPREVRP